MRWALLALLVASCSSGGSPPVVCELGKDSYVSSCINGCIDDPAGPGRCEFFCRCCWPSVQKHCESGGLDLNVYECDLPDCWSCAAEVGMHMDCPKDSP